MPPPASRRNRRRHPIFWSLFAWSAVGVFWFLLTRRQHPSTTLALIVTSSLIIAYAAAAYVNHLLLIPHFCRPGRYLRYASLLTATMLVFTAAALTVIRSSYFTLAGPDPDPNGAVVHFLIDLTGMAVHLALAAVVVWGYSRLTRADSREMT